MDPSQDTTTDPSTLAEINSLIGTLGADGLAIYSNITGKPLTTAVSGNTVVPVQTTQQTIIWVAVIGLLAAFLLFKK